MGREMRSAQSMGWKIRFIPYPCSPVAAWPRDHLADYESIGEEVVSPQVEYYLIAMTAKAIYSVFTTRRSFRSYNALVKFKCNFSTQFSFKSLNSPR